MKLQHYVPMLFLRTLPCIIPFIFVACVDAAATKATIVDDSDTSRIVYFPPGTWNPGNECTTCYANPDKGRALDGTWRDNTASNDQPNVSFNFTFTGTAVEVRCIFYDKVVTWIANTNVIYSIDGVYRGAASHNPTNATDYLYNQSLFRVSDLVNTEHTLRVDLLNPSMLLFDYLVYEGDSVETADTGVNGPNQTLPASSTSLPLGNTSSQNRTKIAAIIGGIVAGVSIIGGVILWFRYRRRIQREKGLQQIARPTTLLAEIEDPPPVHPPSDSKGPSLPQTNGSTRSPGASSTHIIPGFKLLHANPPAFADGISNASPSAMRTSIESLSASSITTEVISAAPNTIHGIPRASQDGTIGVASGAHPVSRPSGFHPPALVSLVYEETLEEPVEEGLMSRYTSSPISASMPPPYSHD